MPTLVNSILEKIDELRVSRDILIQSLNENLGVDASTFDLLKCMDYIKKDVIEPSYAIRPNYNDGDSHICPLNVRLTSTSWITMSFAMDEVSLNKQEFVNLLGMSDNSFKAGVINSVLEISTPWGVEMTREIVLDTNRHTLSFGFTGEINESGDCHFKAEFDGELVYDGFLGMPSFNLPLFLYDLPHNFYGTYEEYEALGGISHIIKNAGFYPTNPVFDLFSLTVSDIVDGKRTVVRDYAPVIDAENKVCFLDKISGKYEYPATGKYNYIKRVCNENIIGKLSTYEYVFNQSAPVVAFHPADQYYINPSEGAIVPTDIVLTSTTKIKMYVRGFYDFNAQTNLDTRLMLGAQPNLLVSPFNSNDVVRGLPWYSHEHDDTPIATVANMVSGANIGFYITGAQDSRGTMHGALSTTSKRDNIPQIASMKDEHVITFGFDVWDVNNFNFDTDDRMKRGVSVDGGKSNDRWFGPDASIHSAFNSSVKTPLCFFGSYNNANTTPADVIALGYENALSQIGYTTGVRYGVKMIEISERNADGSITVTHRLRPAYIDSSTHFFVDTLTGTKYYPFHGTLDVQNEVPDSSLAPEVNVTPDTSVNPDTPETPGITELPDAPVSTILTSGYVMPSKGAIVPTDIKLTPTTQVEMHVKRFENLDELSGFDNKLMISALPDLKIAAYNSNDADDESFRWFGASHKGETDIKSMLQNGNIGVCYYCQGDYLYSTSDTDGGFVTQTINTNDDSGNVIRFGFRPYSYDNPENDRSFWKYITIDNGNDKGRIRSVDESQGTFKQYLETNAKTPICLFGSYNEAEGVTPDNYISLGYKAALEQYGFTTGVRYSVKDVIITERNDDGTHTLKHHLVPAMDSNNNVLLYDTVTKSKYYPYNGTFEVINEPAVPGIMDYPEATIDSVLTDTYVMPMAGAIVPTDIKFKAGTKFKMYIKNIENFDNLTKYNDRLMVSALPFLKLSPYNSVVIDENDMRYLGTSHEDGTNVRDLVTDGSVGFYFYGYGNNMYSTFNKGTTLPQTIKCNDNSEHIIEFGYSPVSDTFDTESFMNKCMKIDNNGERGEGVVCRSSEASQVNLPVYPYTDILTNTPICLFGSYNESIGLTDDYYSSLGCKTALEQYGFRTGARFGVKKIEISVSDAEGNRVTHIIEPARDSNGTILLYDTVTGSKYYPYSGTLNIM